jgi:hypothetical protein
MNAQEAFAVMYPDEALRIRRRALESEAETERMRIKEFEAQAHAAAQKAFWARKRLDTINDELKELA